LIKEITGVMFKDMIINAANCIDVDKQTINDLNVFPVPDGDTGTNMSLTISAAATELRKATPKTVADAADITANALLRGARGNSGVILSLLFRGISKALKGRTVADASALAVALGSGVTAAYNAVMKPTEGTILTVSRLAADAAQAAAENVTDIDELLSLTIEAAKIALDNTVNQNPVLKKAGVVDAGGKGYVCILEGMLKSLRGEIVEAQSSADTTAKADFSSLADEELTFTFDTVFIVRKTTGKPVSDFAKYLDSIGDSLVIGESDDIFKVHVHTDIPGEALNEAQKYGTLELAKIENMRSQRDALANGEEAHSVDDLDDAPLEELEAAPEKKYGIVAVAAGEGLKQTFTDLGADGVIMGGQTMNPSTEDILKQVKRTPAEVVFVLPNNKNIIMAAQQCVPMSGKKVIVIPTKSVQQGISSLLMFDESMDEDELTEALTSACENVHSASVTYAARDSDFGGYDIKEGQYLALLEGGLVSTSDKSEDIAEALCKAVKEFAPELITVFYGENVSEEEANAFAHYFEEAFPGADITVADGGQPVYYYLISVE